MNIKEQINPYQFLLLAFFFSIGSSLLIAPANLAEQAKQDAWIGAIFGMVVGFPLILLFIFLGRRLPHLTLAQLNERILGKWIGKAVTALFVTLTLLQSGSLLFYSGIFLKTNMMPNTPVFVLNALMAVVLVIGVRLGLETIARSAEIFILPFVILFLLLVIAVLPQAKLDHLQPVLDTGFREIALSSIVLVEAAAMNAAILLMIFPALISKSKKATRMFIGGYLAGNTAIVILTFLCIAVLGASYTTALGFPGYEIAKRISIGNFIQRIEGIMTTMWILSIYVKTALYFYAAVASASHLLGKSDYRKLALPMGAIALLLSDILFPNTTYLRIWNDTVAVGIALFIGVVLPLLLTVVYSFRRKTLRSNRTS